MAIKRLIFIRPGETDWNLQGRWQGWVAAPLNEHGRLQVQRLASFIRHIGLSKLYSSDNRRASETAEILVDVLGFEVQYDERLRERNIGIWQGLNVPEIHGWYVQEYEAMLSDPIGYQIPGGESLAQTKERLMAAIQESIAESDRADGEWTLGFIMHTTALRLVLTELIPGVDLMNVNFGNTSVTTVIRGPDGEWQLTAVNDTSHLDDLESRYMPEVEGDDSR